MGGTEFIINKRIKMFFLFSLLCMLLTISDSLLIVTLHSHLG